MLQNITDSSTHLDVYRKFFETLFLNSCVALELKQGALKVLSKGNEFILSVAKKPEVITKLSSLASPGVISEIGRLGNLGLATSSIQLMDKLKATEQSKMMNDTLNDLSSVFAICLNPGGEQGVFILTASSKPSLLLKYLSNSNHEEVLGIFSTICEEIGKDIQISSLV
jgi:hypothetical protein